MEVKTIEDILKLQDDFIKKVQKHMELVSKGKSPSAELLIEENEELLAQYKERLDAVTKAKAETIHRYDEEIIRYHDMISGIEKEIQDGKKALKHTASKAGSKGEAEKE